MIYKVEITEVLQKVCEIETESENKAMEIIKRQYDNGEIILDYTNFIDVSFSETK